jgi:hypothetical protein
MIDPEMQEREARKRAGARKRTLTYCHQCGGILDRELSHPFGLPLVVLQCTACGREETMVKQGDYYKRPGRGRRRRS